MTITRVLAVLLLIVLGAPTPAKTPVPSIAISIDPMVLEFSAPAGGEQHAAVSITNSGSQTELVTARSTDWTTSDNGNVVFEATGIERRQSLASYLHITPVSFVLKAGETRSVSVSLQMPAHVVAATGWSGFILQAQTSGVRDGGISPGGTIFVYNSIGTQTRHLRMQRLVTGRSGNHAFLRASLLNDSDAYVRPIVRVMFENGGAVVRNETVPVNVIFPHRRRSFDIEVPPLPSAAYRAHLLIDYGSDSIIDGVTNVSIP